MQFTFPATEGDGSAEVNPMDARALRSIKFIFSANIFQIAIKLTVGAEATLTGRAEAHLIPRLDIGVNVLNGAAQTTVFATIDASAGLNFTLNAETEGTPVNGTAGDPTVGFNNFESSLSGSVGMDLDVAINVGAEAALGTFAPTIYHLFSD